MDAERNAPTVRRREARMVDPSIRNQWDVAEGRDLSRDAAEGAGSGGARTEVRDPRRALIRSIAAGVRGRSGADDDGTDLEQTTGRKIVREFSSCKFP
jgi:hypothetical protein